MRRSAAILQPHHTLVVVAEDHHTGDIQSNSMTSCMISLLYKFCKLYFGQSTVIYIIYIHTFMICLMFSMIYLPPD